MSQATPLETRQRFYSLIGPGGLSQRKAAAACGISRRTAGRLVEEALQEKAHREGALRVNAAAPFSNDPGGPPNNPQPAWNLDQPVAVVERKFDKDYHGHTYRAFNAPIAYDGFDLARIRRAVSLHRQGIFLETSLLSQTIMSYGPVFAAMSQRIAPANSLPKKVICGHRGLSKILGKQIERQLVPNDGKESSPYFPCTLYGAIVRDIARMGFAVLQHVYGDPDPETYVRPCFTRIWPTWSTQYYPTRRQFVAQTSDGAIDILNDGKFTLVADSEEPHLTGAILALGEETFDGKATQRARAQYIQKYGDPKWIGEMPQGMSVDSPEGKMMLATMQEIQYPNGSGVIPSGGKVNLHGLEQGRSTVMKDALDSVWQYVAAITLGSDGTMTRGTGVYSAPIFAGVRRDIVASDLGATIRGINTGHVRAQLLFNYANAIAESKGWIDPCLDIPLPDPDADARIKSIGERMTKLLALVKESRESGFEVTQDYVNLLASSLEVPAPTLAPRVTGGLQLSITTLEKIVKVNEGRAAYGLPSDTTEKGELYIVEVDPKNTDDENDKKRNTESASTDNEEAQEGAQNSAHENSEGGSNGGETKPGTAESSQ